MHRGRLMHPVFLRERSLVWPNNCTKPPDLTSLAWVRWPLCSDFWQLIGLVFTQQWSHRLYISLNSENIQTQWDRIQLDWDQNSFLEGLFWQGDLLPPYHTSWLCTHIYKVVFKHKIVIWVWDTVLLRTRMVLSPFQKKCCGIDMDVFFTDFLCDHCEFNHCLIYFILICHHSMSKICQPLIWLY